MLPDSKDSHISLAKRRKKFIKLATTAATTTTTEHSSCLNAQEVFYNYLEASICSCVWLSFSPSFLPSCFPSLFLSFLLSFLPFLTSPYRLWPLRLNRKPPIIERGQSLPLSHLSSSSSSSSSKPPMRPPNLSLKISIYLSVYLFIYLSNIYEPCQCPFNVVHSGREESFGDNIRLSRLDTCCKLLLILSY